jgi:anti-anti-sigma factor
MRERALIDCGRGDVRLEGALRAPVSSGLSRWVEAILDRGDRQIVLDLSQLVDIDAAGIGELVSLFNRANAAGGVLQITRPTGRVRRMLEISGVLQVLASGTRAYGA